MQINLSGHNVEITEALRDYVTNKFSKLERFFEHINNVHVVLTVEKNRSDCRSDTPCECR